MISLAPLQGFTDFVYRKAYAQVFSGIDHYYIPYISMKNQQIIRKYEKEILPENNPQETVVPQVLAKDAGEMLFMARHLEKLGYPEINLNLGCPYPMVTNRGRGAGLLAEPQNIESLLNVFFENSKLQLSVKMRAGMKSPTEIEKVIEVLNRFPLTRVILHPRVATQLYTGKIIDSAFKFALENINHRLVFNGDIFMLADFEKRKKQFPFIEHWMLGRGILQNPFLPSEIKGMQVSEAEKREKIIEFHRLVFEGYKQHMDNQGNAINKMKQFWIYFSFNFPEPKKTFKKIKKAKNAAGYEKVMAEIFAVL